MDCCGHSAKDSKDNDKLDDLGCSDSYLDDGQTNENMEVNSQAVTEPCFSVCCIYVKCF